jgi:outer membrane protein assembly factor BamD
VRGAGRLLACAAALLLASCGGKGEVDIATLASSSDQIIWEAGQKAYEKKNWEAARQHFKRIVDAFPQSEYGPAARIALGDSYFNEGGVANYILAVSDYRDFLTLYPSHPRSDYAQFQVAECHYLQRNGPDRDQTETQKALVEYQRLVELYPSSSYLETARKRIAETRHTLARAEFMAGYFYQRTRRAYRAAIARYETILAEYPDYSETDEVLFRMGECLMAQGRRAEALPHLSRLVETYPESGFVGEAKKLIEVIASSPPVPPPAQMPAPSPSPGPSPSPSPSMGAQLK